MPGTKLFVTGLWLNQYGDNFIESNMKKFMVCNSVSRDKLLKHTRFLILCQYGKSKSCILKNKLMFNIHNPKYPEQAAES